MYIYIFFLKKKIWGSGGGGYLMVYFILPVNAAKHVRRSQMSELQTSPLPPCARGDLPRWQGGSGFLKGFRVPVLGFWVQGFGCWVCCGERFLVFFGIYDLTRTARFTVFGLGYTATQVWACVLTLLWT